MTTNRPTFADILNDALARADMPLVRLHEVLNHHGTPIGLSTLSYWRSGQRRPEGEVSVRAVRTMEEVLGLSAGALVESLPTGDRRRPSTGSFPWCEQGAAMLRLAEELGFETMHDDFIERSTTIRLMVGADRGMQNCVAQAALVARHDGARRLPLALMSGGPGFEAECAVPTGFRFGRRLTDAQTGTMMVELLTERAVQGGETVFLEQRVQFSGSEGREWIHHLPSEVGSVTLLVRFDPHDLPSRCEEVLNLSGAEQLLPLRHIGASISTSRTNVGPGHFGIRWEWSTPQEPTGE